MNTINQVALGSQGLIVSAEGIGLMGRTSMVSGQMSVYGVVLPFLHNSSFGLPSRV